MIPMPASLRAPPLRLERIVTQDERELIADVQVAVLKVLSRTDLDLGGDVDVLAVALRYLAAAHGLPVDALALRAFASATCYGALQ